MYYTSYFGNIKKIDRTKYGPLVSITNKKPNFAGSDILDWNFLAPEHRLVEAYKAGTITKEEYAQQYKDFLTQLWPGAQAYISVRYHKNIVFLCYEKKGKFSHRHILADFLNEHGIDCKEI